MSIDTFTTSALADEFNERLVGGRIQDTVELDRETFGLEIYANQQRQYLLLSANNQQPRAMIAPEKLRRGVQKPSTLGLLFRNRIEGMHLQAVRQPPWERIIIFDLINADTELQVIIELIERRANLLLVEDGVILDCARRVGPKDNRYRIILPRHDYVAPPPQENKITPDALDPRVIDRLLQKDPTQKAFSALVKGILGFSPTLAKEVIFRAYHKTNILAGDANPYNLNAALESFLPRLLRRDWEPGLVMDKETELPKMLAVFPLSHLGEWKPTKTVSEAIDGYFGSLEGTAAYDAARIPIRKRVDEAKDRVSRKLASLERELVDQAEIEFLRKSGELLLAYQYTLAPKQEELIAQYDPEGEPLTISIDTSMTPLENAQKYFDRYERKKRARSQLPKRIEEVKNELEFLDQLDADLTMAENWDDIGEVQQALQKNGYWRGKTYGQPASGKSAPIKVTTDEGFVIWIGRNSRQNNIVTFDKSDPYDLWLHARDVPGAHVIIKTNGRDVPPEILERAASWAAYYSKSRNETKALVQVAECRHVRKLKGGNLGQVLVRQELNSIVVKPAPVKK